MTNMTQHLAYKAFGLNIESEFPLPELPYMDSPAVLGNITVIREDLSQRWKAIPKLNSYLSVSDNEVMFQVADVAIFSIRGGNTITVSPFVTTDEDCIRLYILGSCMGILLMQRNVLPLHGSAIVIQNKAYALVGHSGAGKSTLASYLMEQGYRLISDDVIPIKLTDSTPLAIPGYPQQKLWEQSLQYLGRQSSDYLPLFKRETKFAVPVHDQFHSEPLQLAGLFELVVKSEGSVTIEPIQGMERFHTLFNHTYQNLMIDRMGLRQWHFSMLAQFVNQLPMHQLSRPAEGFSSSELTSLLLEAITEGGD
ncbi:aldolase [Paenibacillus wynnii]|uniref:aldolase n=1 Tax=Paenibacillus wynnii TaxID=268407 RepID=UPI0027938EFF|nr:aldolase [Paenibacillus wynnii]MDQ0194099.1 energy-coupling factor transporter ATP-binding protein EcfA2 [Paenibacillus wynnii]